MNNNYYADEIISRVKMIDVILAYGFKPGKGNRIPCPFHGGEHPNMGFNDYSYHCFTCGAKGNVITFVRDLFSLDYQETLAKINQDFALGLPIGKKPSLRCQRQMQRKQAERVREEARRNEEKNKRTSEWDKALGEYVRLDMQQTKYKPKQSGESLHPKFIEALQNLAYAKYRLDCAEEALNEL